MPAMEPLSKTIGLDRNMFTKEEILIVEIELFSRICEELIKIIKNKFEDYLKFIKPNQEMEDTMKEENIMRFVSNDILGTEQYSVQGIACYTQTPEEVICDIAAGLNNAPSLPISRKLIDLHRSVRPDLYRSIMEKIVTSYSISK